MMLFPGDTSNSLNRYIEVLKQFQHLSATEIKKNHNYYYWMQNPDHRGYVSIVKFIFHTWGFIIPQMLLVHCSSPILINNSVKKKELYTILHE